VVVVFQVFSITTKAMLRHTPYTITTLDTRRHIILTLDILILSLTLSLTLILTVMHKKLSNK